MAKKATKKVDKETVKSGSKKATKIKVWRYVNFLLLMISFILFAEMIQTISIAAVAAKVQALAGESAEFSKLTKEAFTEIIMKSNYSMSKMVLVVSGAYALAHVFNYFFYINKRKSWLIIALLVEVVVCVLGITTKVAVGPFACSIVILPIISGLMYLRILKIEEE